MKENWMLIAYGILLVVFIVFSVKTRAYYDYKVHYPDGEKVRLHKFTDHKYIFVGEVYKEGELLYTNAHVLITK